MATIPRKEGIGCHGYDAEGIGCHKSCRRWPKSQIQKITVLTVPVLWAERIDYFKKMHNVWFRQFITNAKFNDSYWPLLKKGRYKLRINCWRLLTQPVLTFSGWLLQTEPSSLLRRISFWTLVVKGVPGVSGTVSGPQHFLWAEDRAQNRCSVFRLH